MKKSKGFTNDAVPALTMCDSPLEGKFAQSVFDILSKQGYFVEYSKPPDARIRAEFIPGDRCSCGARVILELQKDVENARFDAFVKVEEYPRAYSCAMVELDGANFHSDRTDKLRDAEKTVLCLHLGIPLIRFPGTAVYLNAQVCASSVLALCSSQAERIMRESQRSFSDGVEFGEKQGRGAA